MTVQVGHGLSLLVKETKTPGVLSKTWSVRIRINRKYTNRGLGSYPKVKLAEARRTSARLPPDSGSRPRPKNR